MAPTDGTSHLYGGAERNLDDIFDYIAREQHRPAAAAKVLREIDQKCRLYAPPGSRSHRSLVTILRPSFAV